MKPRFGKVRYRKMCGIDYWMVSVFDGSRWRKMFKYDYVVVARVEVKKYLQPAIDAIIKEATA